MAIGARLKQIIDSNGIKVANLAELSGVPAPTIYSLLSRDSNKVSIDHLIKICRSLDVSVEELYYYDVEDKRASNTAPNNGIILTDENEKDIIQLYRKLDKINKAKIKERMETLLEDQSEKSNLKAKKIG